MESIRTASANRTRPGSRGTVVLASRGGGTGRDVHPAGHPDVVWRHWWLEDGRPGLKNGGLSLDEGKCAAAYEATRRREEVRAAALRGRLPAGWQVFSGLAWSWWSESWADLHTDQQARLLAETRSPLYCPPLGYSYFPMDSLAHQLAAVVKLLPLPPDDDCQAAVAFVQRCRRLETAGMRLCATWNDTRQAARLAGMALASQARTFRARDLAVASVVRDHADGQTVQARVTVLGHVRYAQRWDAERVFRFDGIMEQLARFDERRTASDFVGRIRL